MKLLDLESVNCSLVTRGTACCCMSLSCCHHGATQPHATRQQPPADSPSEAKRSRAAAVLQEEIIREAQTMRQQAHANVLPLYCSFVHQHNLWMVMPYVSGGSVLNIMKYAYPEVRCLACLLAVLDLT